MPFYQEAKFNSLLKATRIAIVLFTKRLGDPNTPKIVSTQVAKGPKRDLYGFHPGMTIEEAAHIDPKCEGKPTFTSNFPEYKTYTYECDRQYVPDVPAQGRGEWRYAYSVIVRYGIGSGRAFWVMTSYKGPLDTEQTRNEIAQRFGAVLKSMPKGRDDDKIESRYIQWFAKPEDNFAVLIGSNSCTTDGCDWRVALWDLAEEEAEKLAQQQKSVVAHPLPKGL